MLWRTWIVSLAAVTSATVVAQAPPAPDWPRLEAETLQHFQALLGLDQSNPPGNGKPGPAYLNEVLAREGTRTQFSALDPARPNPRARLKGGGRRHPPPRGGPPAVATGAPAKWTFPPFS